MANPLKGMNFKEALANHFEKIAFGVLVLIGLFFIFTSDWKTESRSPTELKQIAQKASEDLKRSKWREADNFQPKGKTITDQIDSLVAVIKQGPTPEHLKRFALVSSDDWGLYPPESKFSRLVPVTPEAVIVDSFLYQVPLQKQYTVADVDPKTAPKDMGKGDPLKGDDPKKPKRPSPFGKAGDKKPKSSGVFGPAPGGHDGPGGHGGPPEPGAPPGPGGPGGPGYEPPPEGPGGGHGDEPDDMYGGPAGPGGPKRPGKKKKKFEEPDSPPTMLLRFVAVRAVFNLRQQLKNYAIAVHAKNEKGQPDEDRFLGELDIIKIHDFHLQRQEAPAGVKVDWSKIKWQNVSNEEAVRILKAAKGNGTEVVDGSVRNPVITMPLPPITWGDWSVPVDPDDPNAPTLFNGGLGTHPMVRDFQLSAEERKKIEEYEKAILKEQEKQKKKEAEPTAGGFAALQADIAKAQRGVLKAPGADLEKTLGFLNPNGDNADLLKTKKARVNASGNLLLFRYFDFGVKPGFQYRYRVKLILRNPFHGESRNRARFEAIQDQFIETDWSTPSGTKWDGNKRQVVDNSGVQVERNTHFFLEEIDQRIGKLPAARMELYHWHPKYGTIVKSKLDSEIGTFLGGTTRKMIPVLNASLKQKYDAKVTFETDELLIDVQKPPKFDPEAHPDLGLARSKFDRDSQLGIFSRALIATSDGRDTVVDPNTFSESDIKSLYDDQVQILGSLFTDTAEKKDKGDFLTPGGLPDPPGPPGPGRP